MQYIATLLHSQTRVILEVSPYLLSVFYARFQKFSRHHLDLFSLHCGRRACYCCIKYRRPRYCCIKYWKRLYDPVHDCPRSLVSQMRRMVRTSYYNSLHTMSHFTASTRISVAFDLRRRHPTRVRAFRFGDNDDKSSLHLTQDARRSV